MLLCRYQEIIQRKTNMTKQLLLGLAMAVLMCSAGFTQGKKQEAQDSEPAELKVGDEAPDWSMTGSDGKVYKLSDFKNKAGVVVAWYPMALTGG